MRIAVISDLAPGSHRAYAINVAKTAGGFVRHGHEVTVFCRKPEQGWTLEQAGEAYGEPLLQWRCFPGERQADEHLSHRHYLTGISSWAAREISQGGFDGVYARHCWGGIRCAEAGLATVVETHLDPVDDWLGAQTAVRMAGDDPAHRHTQMRGVVTISPRLSQRYIELGACGERVRVVPDAVDPEMFLPPADLGVDPLGCDGGGAPRLVFAGNLYPLNGMPALLEAARLLDRWRVHLVGGPAAEVEAVRAAAGPNVFCHGQVPHRDVPRYLWNADVLALPLSDHHPNRLWASPVKLGEYLASGSPVVCSDVPALRALVEEPAVRWCAPDDGASLAAAARLALAEPHPAGRAEAVEAFVRRHTYLGRAGVVLDLLGLAAGRAAEDATPEAA